mgnify:FL=1
MSVVTVANRTATAVVAAAKSVNHVKTAALVKSAHRAKNVSHALLVKNAHRARNVRHVKNAAHATL